MPIFYSDLLRFQGSIVVYDKNDVDTLWVRVYYNDFERDEIDLSLKRVYSSLISDGSEGILKYLSVDAIDFCTLNFLVCKETLIEEHIAGIPGDEFIKNLLPDCSSSEKSQIAKEFVKFNERCMIRLLGDMRSYNYVFVPIHDFDQVVFRIRAIDFDQQCYEGNLKIYRPQFFKENFKMVELVKEKIQKESVDQYKIEERSIVAKRMLSYKNRLRRLLDCMTHDEVSIEKHIDMIKEEIFEYTHDVNFKKSKNMGEVLKHALDFVKRNYEGVGLKQL